MIRTGDQARALPVPNRPPMTIDRDIPFIGNRAGLEELCDDLSRASWFALDTEFLREKTYYPKLCLVQVATPDRVACIDPLALDDLKLLVEIGEGVGIVLPFVPDEHYFEVVETGTQIDLALAAEMAAVDIDEIYRLNPGFNRCIPGRICIPRRTASMRPLPRWKAG